MCCKLHPQKTENKRFPKGIILAYSHFFIYLATIIVFGLLLRGIYLCKLIGKLIGIVR